MGKLFFSGQYGKIKRVCKDEMMSKEMLMQISGDKKDVFIE